LSNPPFSPFLKGGNNGVLPFRKGERGARPIIDTGRGSVKNREEAGRSGCHSRAGGNPVFPGFSGLPPEFTPAKAEAGVTLPCLSVSLFDKKFKLSGSLTEGIC
jgi:hypothetical protein